MLDSVQALRALAALCVVVYHVDFVARGAFGVDIFFVISGFIICHVTAADHDGFLRKRLIRIVPLYWTGTLCLFVLAFFAPQLLKSAATHGTPRCRSRTRAGWAKCRNGRSPSPARRSAPPPPATRARRTP
ncbi:MAG TPA: acyltransferase [Burkholderiales bacterium]